jgi:hypothetical protein
MPDIDERFKNAKELIAAGRINTLDELYKIVPKKFVGAGLDLNPVRFSNVKSNVPGDFKLSEIIKLSELLETDIYTVVKIFINSID